MESIPDISLACSKEVVYVRSSLALLQFPQGAQLQEKSSGPSSLDSVSFTCPSSIPQSGMRRREILKNPLLNLTSETRTQKERGSMKILCAQRHFDFF